MEIRTKLNCILLVDDDPDDNFFHQIILKKLAVAHKVDIALDGVEALAYLKTAARVPPELIFLDINMPRMNGWEFLERYKNLEPQQKAKTVIMMLTTSANPDDHERAKKMQEVTGIETKPLTAELLTEILKKHFADHL